MNVLINSRNEKSKSHLHVTTLNLYRVLHKVMSTPHLKAKVNLTFITEYTTVSIPHACRAINKKALHSFAYITKTQ